MVDCNQVWGVDEAINYMTELKDFKPIWIEEPTDVMMSKDILRYLKH